MARVARELADALREFARDRRPEQKTAVATLQTELCAARRAELDLLDGVIDHEPAHHGG